MKYLMSLVTSFFIILLILSDTGTVKPETLALLNFDES